MSFENASVIALSRQTTLRQRLDIIANNIANMDTPSFKKETAVFVTYLARTGDQFGERSLSYTQDYGMWRDTQEGNFEATGRDLDIAINEEGYFQVETPQGLRYTRNGRLAVDDQGRLVTSEGFIVLSDRGRQIDIPEDATSISVASDGTLSIERLGQDGGPLNETGLLIDKIGVVTFEDQQRLRKVGGTLYETDQEPIDILEPSLRQGMFEQSNVKPIVEMVDMIATSRAYQAAQRMINTQHETERSAIDKLTRAS